MPKKIRLDQALLSLGMARDQREAHGLILAGKVRVKDQICDKPGTQIADVELISIANQKKFVSRGGLKLDAALKAFDIDPKGKICADAGCSTGGFSDVLLQNGAAKIYAIDTAYGELDWKIRDDARVEVMERTNVVRLEQLPELVELIVVDVSLLGSEFILPVIKNWLTDSGEIVLLLKPQYELAPEKVPNGGIITAVNLHKEVIIKFADSCVENQLYPVNLIRSPIKGGQGNIEFLVHIKKQLTEIGLSSDALIQKGLEI
ncbi:MAG: TlyA family RNA methyltransferase [Bdellovibrionota bacterium]